MSPPPSKINILITSFTGSSLPPTLSLALPPSTPISSLVSHLDSRLPSALLSTQQLLLTTLSSHHLSPSSSSPISSLLPGPTQNDFLSLRLSAPLCGGKGGFGSQLRAAGGRMSKRKKTQEDNGSSRNLDGRRLRTITEAKALAEYLAIKPEMDKKEREARKKRWEKIVEMTEQKQDEIKYGSKKVGLDGKWVEEKEVNEERMREAVAEAMRRGMVVDDLLDTSVGSSSSSGSGSGDDKEMEDVSEEDEPRRQSGGSKESTPPSEVEPELETVKVEDKGKGKEKEVPKPAEKPQARTFFGFDEDDEFMSSDEE
ncbi:telomere stability and silencing-domain-containing protein [Triangularia verruculosa]|uniref:Telomere stability and silencing-domain-containing protein n=1 Tax=Triangularia verruculosa TaxID=2587418 RepID=A0AAN7AXG8_9PEZI|nr:telomere stability and silencing-domain-containing protein [Triangularia verruculosa]